MRNRYCMMVLFVILSLLAACASPVLPASPTSTATQTPSPAPTLKPTQTEKPTATPIPSFEEWSVFNPGAVDISTQDDALILTLKYRTLWFMNQRGVLAYKLVDGDFKITADVFTSKSSDPTQPPGGDGTVQLGGLMARNGPGRFGLPLLLMNCFRIPAVIYLR